MGSCRVAMVYVWGGGGGWLKSGPNLFLKGHFVMFCLIYSLFKDKESCKNLSYICDTAYQPENFVFIMCSKCIKKGFKTCIIDQNKKRQSNYPGTEKSKKYVSKN